MCPHLYIQSSAVEQGTVLTMAELPLLALSSSDSLLAQLQECVQLLAEPEEATQ